MLELFQGSNSKILVCVPVDHQLMPNIAFSSSCLQTGFKNQSKFV